MDGDAKAVGHRSDLAEHDDSCPCAEPDMHVELVRLQEALGRIQQLPHHGCNNCPACLAHKALRGHWPTDLFRCCTRGLVNVNA